MKKLTLLILGLVFSIAGFCREDGFIQTDYGQIHYIKFGQGEPLLIINGGPGLDCDGFIPLAELLADNYMTILFDQRGTGKSTLYKVDSTTVTLELMANDMEAIRNHFKLKNWIILGHSFGGFMAEYYATHYSERVKAMILSSTGGIDLTILNYFNANLNIRLSQTERDSLKFWDNKLKQGDTTDSVKYNKAKFLASAYLYDKKYVPALAKRLAFSGYPRITGLVYKDLFEKGFDCKQTLQDFNKPALIIQGRQDITGDGVAYEAHQVLKNSKLVFINESGHYSWLEQGEEYKSAVEEFISSTNNNGGNCEITQYSRSTGE